MAEVKWDPVQNGVPGSFTVVLYFLEFHFNNLTFKLDVNVLISFMSGRQLPETQP